MVSGMTKIRLNYKFVAKMPHNPKTFDTVKTTNLATGKKNYTPTIAGKPLRVAWTTKSSAIEYAKRVFNRYRLKLAIQQTEEQNELNS